MVSRALGGGATKLGHAVLELTTEDGKLVSGLSAAERKAGSTFSTIGKLGAAAFVSIGVAAAAGLGASVMAAADFEQAMNVLRFNTKATDAQFKALGDEAKALGADIHLPGTSATDAAEAMLELSKAGLSVKDTLAAARGVLQLSAAGQLQNAAAAEITANALNTFNLEGKEAIRVADLLAAGALASSTSVEGIAEGLKHVGSSAAAAGMPIDEVVGYIALLAQAGIKGEMAGTGLRAMMQSLANPTDAASEALAKLNVHMFDARGNSRNFTDVTGDLTRAMSGLTDEQRAVALGTIFTNVGLNTTNAILGQGVDKVAAMRKAVQEQGVAAGAAAAQNSGLKGAIDGLRSSVETFMVWIGTPMLGALANAARGASGLLEDLQRLAGFFINGYNGWQFGGEQWSSMELAARAFGVEVRKVMDFVERLPAKLGEIKNAIASGDWEATGRAIGDGLGSGLAQALRAATWVMDTVTSLIKKVDWEYLGGEVATPLALGMVKGFVSHAPEIGRGLLTMLSSSDNMVNEGMAGIRRLIVAGLVALWDELVMQGRRLIDALVTGWNENKGHLVESAVQLGRDAAAGLARGVYDNLPAPLRAAVDMAGRVIDVAKDQLESHSPSEVFRRIGHDVTAGLAIGVYETAKDAQDAIKSAIDSIKTSLRNEQVAALFGDPGALAKVQANQQQMLTEAGEMADRIVAVLGVSMPEAIGLAWDQMQQQAQARAEQIAAAEQALATVQRRFRDQEIEAYLAGDQRKLSLLKASNVIQMQEVQRTADQLVAVYGVDVPTALEAAMQHVTRAASEMEAATKRAADRASAMNGNAFNLTTQLWQQAGQGASVQGLLNLQSLAQAAAAAQARNDISADFTSGKIGINEAQASFNALNGTQTVRVELSSDLRIAGEP